MKLSFMMVAVAAARLFGGYAPVTFQDAKDPVCSKITCQPVQCQPPFKWVNAKDAGTCCPVCESPIPVPEDRSWAEGLTGGVGLHMNADQAACRTAFCPTLHCAETDATFKEGGCCSSCP